MSHLSIYQLVVVAYDNIVFAVAAIVTKDSYY